MSRVVLVAALALWAGATLLLGELRWFRRRALVERLQPYTPGLPASTSRATLLAGGSLRALVGPVAQATGERLARLFGVNEQLADRLERIHSPATTVEFRTRQLGWTVAAFGVGALSALALAPPPLLGAVLVLGAPLLAFLVLEQRIASASAAWQQQVFRELPVVSEQLGMLLASGYSLGGAIGRIAERGRGACSLDLQRVVARVQQGLSDVEALREWAAIADVDALDRLVGVLALNRQAADLGRLISEEARSIRREAQRRLVESIERRAQQVWIPVTVATLVPGVLFLAVPFIEAMRLFTGQ